MAPFKSPNIPSGMCEQSQIPVSMEMTLNHFATKEGLGMFLGGVAER